MPIFCSNCGSKLDDDSDFCTNCGTKVDDVPAYPFGGNGNAVSAEVSNKEKDNVPAYPFSGSGNAVSAEVGNKEKGKELLLTAYDLNSELLFAKFYSENL